MKLNVFQAENLRSFKTILLFALIFRLIAVLFSQGYGMHDDHFLVIESSASWANGFDYNGWLPWSAKNTGVPEGHSFTYVGLNFIYFSVMKFLGVMDPKILMIVNRLLHALASMLVVWLGIKITEKLSSRENAVKVGWILALLWIFPFLSVRNLVEVAAIPFLMLGLWQMIKNPTVKSVFIAGLLIGMSVSFRYQIGIFAMAVAAYYFFRWQFKFFFSFSLGIILIFCLTQGIVDYCIWGYPFAELISYVTYNMKEGAAYLPNSNYLMYFFVLMGSTLVPMGLLLGAGFFRSFKKYAVLFVPTMAFILFHTIYPNRQERFILTVLPLFIMLGVMGYELFKESGFKRKLWRVSIIAFWVLNIPLLLFATTMYTKKSRVESMYYLYEQKAKPAFVLLEGTGNNDFSLLPLFYAQSWKTMLVPRTEAVPNVKTDPFDYIYFFSDTDLQKRIAIYKQAYPNMKLVKKCYPSNLDVLLRKLNPRNTNEYIEIWKTNEAH
ncbi:MAG: hypothetical protein K0R65_919 [Crocinitomicaceae bacterium]|jgi:hypothetical protein|nr:hypothetical protein [Crocinitomicaceae bacterium]